MKSNEALSQRLNRLQKWTDRCDRLLDREGTQLENLYRKSLAELEAQKKEALENFAVEELKIQGELDLAGKEFSRTKYQLERDTTINRNEMKKAEDAYHDIEKRHQQDLTRLNEEKLNVQISHDRQISALRDLYDEKVRHLTVTRARLQQEFKVADQKTSALKEKYGLEADAQQQDWNKKISTLREHADSKKSGWDMAVEALRKELESISQEKGHLEKRLSEIRGEKEKELEALKLSMSIAREQLNVDKATLIEKAEEDQRRCESEVEDLKKKIATSEQELVEFTTRHEQTKKDSEEAFTREESMLKEAVKVESEKRDYEQKLFEQEKSQKEKELSRLREEYEKKKWHWDNQVRTLMLQKTVQDSEHEAERMRVDREARTALRGLEAKRDELKQRLSDIKSRHTALMNNSQKENELVSQRWHWRRDRLWSLWQNRLEVLKKERGALQEQIAAIQQRFAKEQSQMLDVEGRELKRTENMQGFLIQGEEQTQGSRKQKEIQIELEKTRVFAQIKECETLVSEWMDRIKMTQEEIAKNNTGLVAQMNYLDKWYREEEHETALFIENLQKALNTCQNFFDHVASRNAA